MRPLSYTFVGDGPSDRALLPIINWILGAQSWVRDRGFINQVADLSDEDPPLGRALEPRLSRACELYPCDLLFIHRDAERESLEKRWDEIEAAARRTVPIPWVPIVPVRMTEAWLLTDENAIRRAADNPSGSVDLHLPGSGRLDSIADPKDCLREALLTASEKRGRRRQSFRRSMSRRVQRVADLTDDFSPLRALDAFRAFEERIQLALARLRLEIDHRES